MTTTSKQLLTWGLCGIQRYAVSAMVSHKMLVEEKGKKKPSFSYKFLRQRCYSALQSIGAPPRNIPPVSTIAIGGCLDGKCAKEPVISV